MTFANASAAYYVKRVLCSLQQTEPPNTIEA